MNIYKREMKNNLKGLIIWCLSMAFMIYAGMVKYSAFQKTGDAANELFDSLPAPLQAIFGIDTANGDLTSISVFYSIFFVYFVLIAAVHSTMLGAIIVSKEERDKTADFLLVKPIKRSQILTRKILAAMTNILIFNFITFIISLVCVEYYNDGDFLGGKIFVICIALLFIQFLFLGSGFLLGAIAKTSKRATSIGTAIILGSFILKVVMDLNKDMDFLKIISPFEYFSSADIMLHDKFDYGYSVIAILIVIVTVMITYYKFDKRNIK